MCTSTQLSPYALVTKLEGGAIIRNETCGIAEVKFSPEYTAQYGKPAYEIYINGKKLTKPIPSFPEDRPCLVGSRTITVKHSKSDELFEIIENDNKKERYMHSIEHFRDPMSYRPHYGLSIGEQHIKIQEFEDRFPDFVVQKTVANKHGFAIFGKDSQGYALYYANPDEKELKKIPIITGISRGNLFALSTDGTLKLSYLRGRGWFLNSIPAYAPPGALCVDRRTNNLYLIL